MKLIRQMLLGLALCGLCCNLATGEQAGQLVTLPARRTAAREMDFQLARLPAVSPMVLSGFGDFASWHRADLKLAPDHIDDKGWGSGKPARLPPWRLLPESAAGWSFTGLMNLGTTFNADHPTSRFNGPQTFNDRSDFQLNQLYLSFERSPDTGQRRIDWGARVDLMFGTDYIFVQSAGWETQPDGDNALNGLTTGNGNPDLYGLAVPQAFVDVACDQFNLRLGHFYTIVGYEGVVASSNFFYSHAYTLQYGEPLTHTGGLLSWCGEHVTVRAGVVNGWNKVDGLNDDAAFLGGITYASERSSLGISVISGTEDGFANRGRRTMYSLVWQRAITDRLAYVLQHDLGYQVDSLGPSADAQWYGINQYLYCAFSDAWKLGARFEWFRDVDGTRLAGVFARNGGLGLPAAGFAGSYYNATFGANWTPNRNLTVRPEVRWDWSEDTGLAPFADFTSDSQFTFAIDAVYIF